MRRLVSIAVLLAALLVQGAAAKITLVNVVSVAASATTIAVNVRTILHKTTVGVKVVKKGAVKVGKVVKKVGGK